jgi:phage tail sheath gpL-like
MEGSFAAANTAGQVIVGVPRSRLPSDLSDAAELNEALHQNVTALDIEGTEMAMVRSVTTRFLDENGRENYVLLDTSKVTVSDFVADDIELKFEARFGGFKLAPDSDAPVPARTATPEIVRRSLIEWLREYEKAGLVRGVAEHLDEIRVEISDSAPGRLDFELPEAVVNICAVTVGDLIRF